MSACERCNGSGFEDSGGVQPWGEPILVECECRLMERNMDELRKQFLEWFGEEFESINNSEELHVQAIKMIAWQSWVKSRSVIVIKLPTELQLKKYACSDCISVTLDEVENAIRAAGIKVKE